LRLCAKGIFGAVPGNPVTALHKKRCACTRIAGIAVDLEESPGCGVFLYGLATNGSAVDGRARYPAHPSMAFPWKARDAFEIFKAMAERQLRVTRDQCVPEPAARASRGIPGGRSV
jgi:hypothetical protein